VNSDGAREIHCLYESWLGGDTVAALLGMVHTALRMGCPLYNLSGGSGSIVDISSGTTRPSSAVSKSFWLDISKGGGGDVL
jgi:hypothetical protein